MDLFQDSGAGGGGRNGERGQGGEELGKKIGGGLGARERGRAKLPRRRLSSFPPKRSTVCCNFQDQERNIGLEVVNKRQRNFLI